MLERRLWLAVLRAQADLGVDVPDGAVDAYERGGRPGRPRLDRRARAGHQARREGPHRGVLRPRRLRARPQGHDVAGPHRERRAAAGPRRARPRPPAEPSPRWPGWPSGRPSTPSVVMTGRTHNVPAQATTLGKRFANAGEELLQALRRLDDLIARYPLRGIKGPVGTQQDMLDLLGSEAAVDELERRVAEHLGFASGLGAVGPGVPALARPRRRVGARAAGVGSEQPGHHHPADGRPRAGDRGLQARPGRLVGHAAQDEHPLVRADQRVPGDPRRPPGDGLAASPATSGTRATSPARWSAGWPCPTRSSPPTGCSRPSSPCWTTSAPTPR